MQNNKREKTRIIEVFTGIVLILSTLSVLIAFLTNFEFASPDRSIEEDLNFLSESALQQKTSAITWLVTGVLFVFLLPLYLMVFYRFQRWMQVINGLLITAMAMLFFRTGMAGFSIANIIESVPGGQILQPENQLLSFIRDSMLLIKIGLTAYGGYIFVLSITIFRRIKFSGFLTILLFLSGPVLIVYTWLNPEHIITTSSLAISAIGLLMTGTKLVNKGLLREEE